MKLWPMPIAPTSRIEHIAAKKYDQREGDSALIEFMVKPKNKQNKVRIIIPKRLD